MTRHLSITAEKDESASEEKTVKEIAAPPVGGPINFDLCIRLKKGVSPTEEKVTQEILTGMDPEGEKPMDIGKVANNEGKMMIVEPAASFKNSEGFATPNGFSTFKLYQRLDCNVMVPPGNKAVMTGSNLAKKVASGLTKYDGSTSGLPASRDLFRRENSVQNIFLPPGMSKAVGGLLEALSNGSVSCQAIRDSQGTSNTIVKIPAVISPRGRGCIFDIQPSMWTTVKGTLNAISLGRLVISSTSNLHKQLGNVSGRALSAVPPSETLLSMALMPSDSAPQNKTPTIFVPQIDLSSMHVLEPSILGTLSFVPFVGIPLSLGFERTHVAPEPEVPKRIAFSRDLSAMDMPSSSCSATSPFVPPSVSNVLDNTSAGSPASTPLGLEPACTVPKYKTPVSSITLSPTDIPASFPSTTSSFLRAFARPTPRNPSNNLIALQVVLEKLALHHEKHEEVKARASKATSRLRKLWIHDAIYRRCLKAKKSAEKALRSSLDERDCLCKEEAEIKSRMSFGEGIEGEKD